MKVGIFYFTTSGNTEDMANIIEKVALEKGAEVIKKEFSNASSDDLNNLDIVALGTPAQGTEEVDDTEFRPFYEDNKDNLKDKKIFLFGSFGWGGGEYMENFSNEIKEAGLNPVSIYTHLENVDSEAEEELIKKFSEIL